MQELLQHAESLSTSIMTLKNPVIKKDLIKMLQVVDRQLTALSREGVECNRLHRATIRYQNIADQCVVMLKNLEQHLIYAKLKQGWPTIPILL